MKESMKATKKPVTIEFIEWTGDNLYSVITFIEGEEPNLDHPVASEKWSDYENIVRVEGLLISTMEGKLKASVGDIIIKGVAGEFYPCKPDIFHKTYVLL